MKTIAAMQCKDVPDIPVLEFLAQNPDQWHNWYFGDEYDVHLAMPPNTPEKIVHAKLNKLIRRGLVDGCTCGCRGDYVITSKGLDLISNGEWLDSCDADEDNLKGALENYRGKP